MSRIYVFALVTFLLLFVSTVYAERPPRRCPTVEQIQKVGLSSNLVQDAEGKWYAGRSSQAYGTCQKWTFVIGGISAPNKQKALLEASEALATLRYLSGPSRAPAQKWLCVYDNDEQIMSGAVTPPINRLEAIRELD